MDQRPKRLGRWAIVAALAASLTLPTSAWADSLSAGSDQVLAGTDPTLDVGTVAPGAIVDLAIPFWLVCANGSHVDPGQTVALAYAGGIAPLDGQIVTVGDGSAGPVPGDWTPDGTECPVPTPTLRGTLDSAVRLIAPTAAGVHTFLLTWDRLVTPTGSADSLALRGGTALQVVMEVAIDTPPVITVPESFTVEGNTTGGWTAAFVVAATDAQDDPPPTPACDVAAGDVLPLGRTLVTCSVTDSAGLSDSAGFEITVVDSTAPVLLGVPADVAATADASGRVVVSWTDPIATDVVDGAPAVACDPASGTSFPVGTTTVGCMATDASGNVSRATFDVRVAAQPEPPVETDAVWHEPLTADASSFVANRGRTIPVRVSIMVDGVARATGAAALRIDPCGGGVAHLLDLAYSGGRWVTAIDTAPLAGPCHTVTAVIDGIDAGALRLELRGGEITRDGARGRPR